MAKQKQDYQVVPFPKIRRLMVDGGRLGRQKHLVHGLVAFDVTCARRALHDYKARSGESLSFTAFMIACLGKAVAMNGRMQACRTWGDRLVIFEDVDVNTMFEVEVGGEKVIRPHTIRAAQNKTVREIHDEIRRFQSSNESSREAGFIDKFVLLPGFIRRAFLKILFRSPNLFKEMSGTVSLTSVGMFGSGAGWAIPVPSHTLQISLGGIEAQPRLIDGKLENRELLSVTVSFDHDLVDGAPAARFIQRFRELVESGDGLDGVAGPS